MVHFLILLVVACCPRRSKRGGDMCIRKQRYRDGGGHRGVWRGGDFAGGGRRKRETLPEEGEILCNDGARECRKPNSVSTVLNVKKIERNQRVLQSLLFTIFCEKVPCLFQFRQSQNYFLFLKKKKFLFVLGSILTEETLPMSWRGR